MVVVVVFESNADVRVNYDRLERTRYRTADAD